MWAFKPEEKPNIRASDQKGQMKTKAGTLILVMAVSETRGQGMQNIKGQPGGITTRLKDDPG